MYLQFTQGCNVGTFLIVQTLIQRDSAQHTCQKCYTQSHTACNLGLYNNSKNNLDPLYDACFFLFNHPLTKPFSITRFNYHYPLRTCKLNPQIRLKIKYSFGSLLYIHTKIKLRGVEWVHGLFLFPLGLGKM